MRSRHRHRNSMDGSSMLQAVEAKKATAFDKLAEIWTVDPKRAKRILENRQSAARTKERKARYIIEHEKSSNASNRSNNFFCPTNTLPDASGLTTEKIDLKLQLQAMEQQAHLCDALNEAMKNEAERLKVATGELLSCADNFNLGMSQVPFTQSSFSRNRLQPGSGGPHNVQMLQFHPFHSNMSNSNQQMLAAAHSNVCSDMLQQDPLGRFQGLDINSRDLI